MGNKQSTSEPQYPTSKGTETKSNPQYSKPQIEKPQPIAFEYDGSDSSSIPVLAWCSAHHTIVGIHQVTKQGCVSFEAIEANSRETFNIYPRVKHLSGTSLLAYRHYNNHGAPYETMIIYDVSKKNGKVSKIFSFKTLAPGNATWQVGDLAYNPRRNILVGLDNISGGIADHWFLVDPHPSKGSDYVKLFRKTACSRYQSPITSRDFHPSGEILAEFETEMLTISNVDRNNCSYKSRISQGHVTNMGCGLCRWSTNLGEPLLFVKYGWSELNIFDVEKKKLILNSGSIFLDSIRPKNATLVEAPHTYCIDVSPTNGNLLVSSGTDQIATIYDRRESKIVKRIQRVETCIYCVRWDQSGELVAVTDAGGVKVYDFKTDKFIREGIASGLYPVSATFI